MNRKAEDFLDYMTITDKDQGIFFLCKHNKFSPLGLLCEFLDLPYDESEGIRHYRSSYDPNFNMTHVPPAAARIRVGMKYGAVDKLVELSIKTDRTFKQIAELIWQDTEQFFHCEKDTHLMVLHHPINRRLA
ncbi:MAG: hypothetical protein KAJ03_04115 [Gammaproteobacteria bacterium]|nr:hypothetical protein [Gammaproteobacteria bacterium]